MNWLYSRVPEAQDTAGARLRALPVGAASPPVTADRDPSATRPTSGAGHRLVNIAIATPPTTGTVRRTPIQPKLSVSQPGDRYEQEADRVADSVMRMPVASVQRKAPCPAGASACEGEEKLVQTKPLEITPLVQRQSADLPEEEKKKEEENKKDEQETNVQAKEAAGRTVELKPRHEAQIAAHKGGGQPLPKSTRAFFEPRFGHDFSKVRVHHDAQAAASASAVNAMAYTVGRDVVFNHGQYAPHRDSGKRLLAHELTHVVQQGEADVNRAGQRDEKRGLPAISSLEVTPAPSRVVQRRALTAAEETAAIASGRGLFDSITLRVLQTITGVPAADRDGVIGPQTVRAISDWQTARGLTDNGIVNLASLDRLVRDSLATGRAEHGIQLVLDYFNLNTATDTLTVRHRTGATTFEGITFVGLVPRPVFTPGSTTFEEGNLRVIEVGDPAFVDATTLRTTIQKELARAAPARAPVGATPARLNATQVRSAVRYTASKYSDERSVRAIQGLVGAPVSGIVDASTVQFIAEAQHAAGLGVDGKVGLVTTENFYTRMIARGNPNSALRLLVDYFDMKDQGNLLSIYFDPTVAALASTDYRPSEPVRVRVGPNALTLPFSGAVHNIAHEMEHVRRLREGIVPASTHEFLGEALEILSIGMPEEPLDPVTPTHDAFIDDATRCLANWNLMPLADRRRFRSKFIAVRRKVLKRIDAGTAAQRLANAALRASYVAVMLP